MTCNCNHCKHSRGEITTEEAIKREKKEEKEL